MQHVNFRDDVPILQKNLICIERAELLGRGSFGVVYRGVLYGERVAIKLLRRGFDVSKMWEEFEQEVRMLQALSHQNVIAFRGVCLDPPCIVTEYCPGGSLDSFIRDQETIFQNPSPYRSEKGNMEPSMDIKEMWIKRLELIVGIACGMYYLHYRTRPIIHRDLKSPNVLVKKDRTPTIADFGLATHKAGRVKFFLNPKWGAPEVVWEGKEACPKSDVYSFGIIMWEILTGENPWTGYLLATLPYHIGDQGVRPEVPADLVPKDWAGVNQYIELMRNCWAQERQDRPDFDTIVNQLSCIWQLANSPEQPPEMVPLEEFEEGLQETDGEEWPSQEPHLGAALTSEGPSPNDSIEDYMEEDPITSFVRESCVYQKGSPFEGVFFKEPLTTNPSLGNIENLLSGTSSLPAPQQLPELGSAEISKWHSAEYNVENWVAGQFLDRMHSSSAQWSLEVNCCKSAHIDATCKEGSANLSADDEVDILAGGACAPIPLLNGLDHAVPLQATARGITNLEQTSKLVSKEAHMEGESSQAKPTLAEESQPNLSARERVANLEDSSRVLPTEHVSEGLEEASASLTAANGSEDLEVSIMECHVPEKASGAASGDAPVEGELSRQRSTSSEGHPAERGGSEAPDQSRPSFHIMEDLQAIKTGLLEKLKNCLRCTLCCCLKKKEEPTESSLGEGDENVEEGSVRMPLEQKIETLEESAFERLCTTGPSTGQTTAGISDTTTPIAGSSSWHALRHLHSLHGSKGNSAPSTIECRFDDLESEGSFVGSHGGISEGLSEFISDYSQRQLTPASLSSNQGYPGPHERSPFWTVSRTSEEEDQLEPPETEASEAETDTRSLNMDNLFPGLMKKSSPLPSSEEDPHEELDPYKGLIKKLIGGESLEEEDHHKDHIFEHPQPHGSGSVGASVGSSLSASIKVISPSLPQESVLEEVRNFVVEKVASSDNKRWRHVKRVVNGWDANAAQIRQVDWLQFLSAFMAGDTKADISFRKTPEWKALQGLISQDMVPILKPEYHRSTGVRDVKSELRNN